MRFPTTHAALAAFALALTPALALAVDSAPPVIKHTPVPTLTRGQNLIVLAHMKDESAIFGATLWYRAPGTLVYSSAEMIRKDEDLWGASIPTTTNVEYYIEAYDEYGNGPALAGSDKEPFLVKVIDAAPVVQAEQREEAEVTKTPNKIPTAGDFTNEGDDISLPGTERVPDNTVSANDDDLADQKPVKKLDPKVIAGPVEPQKPQEPIYTQWWFIGGAGVIGAAAITTAVILLQPQPVERNVFGTGLRTQ